MYHFKDFLGTLSSFVLIILPAYWSLLNLIFLVTSISLYKFRDRTCFAAVCFPARNRIFSLRLSFQTHEVLFLLFVAVSKPQSRTIKRPLLVFNSSRTGVKPVAADFFQVFFFRYELKLLIGQFPERHLCSGKVIPSSLAVLVLSPLALALALAHGRVLPFEHTCSKGRLVHASVLR
jgi:hypothetical protein